MTSSTFVTLSPCPSCITSFVTLTSRMITTHVIFTMSYTVLTTVYTVPPLATFYYIEKRIYLKVNCDSNNTWMKYNIPHCHLTCITICSCPPRYTRETRSVLYMTRAVFTVSGTWSVTIYPVDTGIFTS